jgi:hypothetical protein
MSLSRLKYSRCRKALFIWANVPETGGYMQKIGLGFPAHAGVLAGTADVKLGCTNMLSRDVTACLAEALHIPTNMHARDSDKFC